MAASRRIRAGLPSLLGIVLALLAPVCARASLDHARLISTVRNGPLEMRVALEDSLYLTGQRTCVLVCVTNIDRTVIPFVPVPDRRGDAFLWAHLSRIAPGGAWFDMHGNVDCGLHGIASFMGPPISPLEPSGSTCSTLSLNNSYGTDVTPPQFRGKTHENLNADPTYALMNSRLAAGRYALQVSYTLKGEQNHWRQPILLESDTLFFDVSGSLGPREDSLLAGYARAVDSALAVPRPTMKGVASQWLPRFSNSRVFIDVFMEAGRDSISPDRLFAWMDPHGKKPTSRAMLLDLLFRLSAPIGIRDPSTVSAFARGDLSRRVIEDWKARPRRWAFRDSVYAERKNSKYLIRGYPPYGTWVEPGNQIEGFK